MGKTLVTGGTGFVGLHLVRELARRGDELRLLVREQSNTAPLQGIEWERASGDLTDRDSVRRAMQGVESVFHVAGTTSMRTRARDRVFEVNVEGTRNVMEEAQRAEVSRVVLTSSSSAVGAAKPGETIDEDHPFTVGRLGIAYINSKHEAELVAMRTAAKGLPVVIVNPSFVLGPDDPNPSGTSNALVRRMLLRRIPGYLDGAINIVDVRDVATGHLLAAERGRTGERYLLTERGGGDGVHRPGAADLGRRGPLRHAVVHLSQREGARGTRLGTAVARGDPRGHRPLATRAVGRAGRGPPAHRPRPARDRQGPPRASLQLMSDPRRVLYRCGTPTNFLCPCGAAARRLNKLGLEYRTERVRRQRSRRPEIIELTGLPYVPVLVDADEVISDSRRILQYLDWRYDGRE
jgi:nucleoside-diphosphate-sugar epimerase